MEPNGFGSKNSLTSTYDNEEAISKRKHVLLFISETLDKINRFQGSDAGVV